MNTIDHNGVTLHRWECGASTFLARPELGARLMKWDLRLSESAVRPVIHWPENADFSEFARVRGGNPILFPFSGRSFHQGKFGYWPDSEGVVRPMPMHGFARNGKFKLVEMNDRGFTAELLPTEEDYQAYPYDYRFTVCYTFKELSLKVTLTLENRGNLPILWSAGHHFYFTLPWHKASSRADYRFNIPAECCYTHSADGTLCPIESFNAVDSFGNPENSDRIFTQLSGNCARFGPANGSEDIHVRILQDTDTASPWNAFVIWRESEESPFYCVEPWMGPPNGAEHGKGLHTVQQGKRSSFAVEISLK